MAMSIKLGPFAIYNYPFLSIQLQDAIKDEPRPTLQFVPLIYSTLAKDAIGLLAKYVYGPFLLDPSDIGSGSTDGPSR